MAKTGSTPLMYVQGVYLVANELDEYEPVADGSPFKVTFLQKKVLRFWSLDGASLSMILTREGICLHHHEFDNHFLTN